MEYPMFGHEKFRADQHAIEFVSLVLPIIEKFT